MDKYYSHPTFVCPHCRILSQQAWNTLDKYGQTMFKLSADNIVAIARCFSCNEISIWFNKKMIFPKSLPVPQPNSSMPPNIVSLYLEAANICNDSPRGAAALLRLAVQTLCGDLGESGTNINNDIKELVKKGLPVIVQQSLDIVRVTGNDAVHPGQIDTDNFETVLKIFELINIIVEYMIALPNKVSGLYNSLPAGYIASVERRDGKV